MMRCSNWSMQESLCALHVAKGRGGEAKVIRVVNGAVR